MNNVLKAIYLRLCVFYYFPNVSKQDNDKKIWCTINYLILYLLKDKVKDLIMFLSLCLMKDVFLINN